MWFYSYFILPAFGRWSHRSGWLLSWDRLYYHRLVNGKPVFHWTPLCRVRLRLFLLHELGDYGTCDVCGKVITGHERLAATPRDRCNKCRESSYSTANYIGGSLSWAPWSRGRNDA